MCSHLDSDDRSPFKPNSELLIRRTSSCSARIVPPISFGFTTP